MDLSESISRIKLAAIENDPEKRGVDILYTGSNPETPIIIDLGRITLSNAIIALFGDSMYQISRDRITIRIKKVKINAQAFIFKE